MSRKVFTAGEVLAAADVNSFLMDQTVMSFAGTAARGSAIPSPVEGMYTHLEDTDRLQFWNGSAWTLANKAASAVGTAGYNVLSASPVQYISVSITCTGRPVFVSYSYQYANLNSGSNRTVGARAKMDGTIIGIQTSAFSELIGGAGESISEGILVTPSSGSRTFTFEAFASAGSSCGIYAASLQVFEI